MNLKKFFGANKDLTSKEILQDLSSTYLDMAEGKIRKIEIKQGYLKLTGLDDSALCITETNFTAAKSHERLMTSFDTLQQAIDYLNS